MLAESTMRLGHPCWPVPVTEELLRLLKKITAGATAGSSENALRLRTAVTNTRPVAAHCQIKALD